MSHTVLYGLFSRSLARKGGFFLGIIKLAIIDDKQILGVAC